MTFDAREISRDEGEPVELYLFRFGTTPGSYHAYTDAEQDIVYDGITYEAIPVGRGTIKASGTLDRQKLDVTMPKWLGLPERFRVWPPSHSISYTIRQGHIGDPEFFVISMGRVLSCAREEAEAKLTCEPVQTAMKRTGLRENWQLSCPHVLYGNRCRANKEAAKRTVTILSLTHTELRIVPDALAEPARYVNGLVEWEGPHNREARMILRSLGQDRFLIAGSLEGLKAGDEVDMFFGCARTMDHCRLFNNILNFGGDAWIPTKNPVGVNPHW